MKAHTHTQVKSHTLANISNSFSHNKVKLFLSKIPPEKVRALNENLPARPTNFAIHFSHLLSLSVCVVSFIELELKKSAKLAWRKRLYAHSLTRLQAALPGCASLARTQRTSLCLVGRHIRCPALCSQHTLTHTQLSHLAAAAAARANNKRDERARAAMLDHLHCCCCS